MRTFLSCYITVIIKLRVCVLVASNSAAPWTVAHQAPLSMEFSWQEYWSGVPFLPLGDLPDPGIESASPALAGGFFTASATWEALLRVV